MPFLISTRRTALGGQLALQHDPLLRSEQRFVTQRAPARPRGPQDSDVISSTCYKSRPREAVVQLFGQKIFLLPSTPRFTFARPRVTFSCTFAERRALAKKIVHLPQNVHLSSNPLKSLIFFFIVHFLQNVYPFVDRVKNV